MCASPWSPAPSPVPATAPQRSTREPRAGGLAGEEGLALAVEPESRRLRLGERRGAVVLLSGGLDSATVLALALAEGLDGYALTVDYGQRHRIEITAAARVADHLGAADHRVVKVELGAFGGSALTDSTPVPHPESPEAIGRSVPPTYVPARNTVLLALALAWAEVLELTDIYIGANARDFSGYPDCRPTFIRAFEELANVATRAATEGDRRFVIHAPLIDWSKAKIIRKGAELGVDFSLTHSCYDPSHGSRACGLCDACILRREGFRQAGVEDPTLYAASQ